MAGFKTFWILCISLFILSGCLPQVKETDCAEDEAFNSTLRTCVPVVGGPSSFLSIDSFSPTSVQSKYKSDTNDIELSVTISNPYVQSYTVEWKRIFYSNETTLTATKSGNSSSYKFKPSTQSTNLGSHLFAVKLKNSEGKVVDTHTFEVIVSDTPKPIIDSTTISPPSYDAVYTPIDPIATYAFTILNNNASLSGLSFNTNWKLYRSGVLEDDETDYFIDETEAGKNYPEYTFDPSTMTVGSYILLARVKSGLNVVAEKQWAFTIKHPDLSNIISRNIYKTSSSPPINTTTFAYHGINYNTFDTYNFIPETVTTPAVNSQGDYCVKFSSGEGSYSGDGKYIRVDYFLNNNTLIFSKKTDSSTDEVCLSDATVGELNNLVFNNTNSTTSQNHTLVARVYDEGTENTEYSTSNINTGLGTYPITWNFLVKPQNEKPKVTFGSQAFSCSTTSSTTKSGCSVNSDTNFTVTINLTSDDFYTFPANEANFNYSIRLYQNGTLIEECTKSDPGSDGITDVTGSDGYSCALNIPGFNASGPINTSNYSYQIRAEISDTGSPLAPTTPSTSETLYWNLVVNEINTAPSISSWSVLGSVNEGANITFSASITDPERDNFSYTIKYCTNPLCTTNATLKSGIITRTNNTNPYALNLSHTLSEDFLLNLTNLDCDEKKRDETCDVDFFLAVTDDPNSATPLSATSGQETSTITNKNPLPELTEENISPAPSVFNLLPPTIFVGFPLTISQTPSISISDSSSVPSEKTHRYQWFSKINNGVMNWKEIEGATSHNLNWTPSLIEGGTSGLSLLLCIEDQPVSAVSVVNTTNSKCDLASPWTLTVLNNISVVQDLSTAPSSTELALNSTSTGNETAVWYETASTFNSVTSSAAYVAMFGNDKQIHIKKVLVKDSEGIDTLDPELLVSFNALPSGTTDSIKDLSITGTGNSSELYVAYLASQTGSPQSFYPQVRRIDLKSTPGKSIPNNHQGKFGFDYDGLGLTNTCTPAGECTTTATSGVTTVSFAPTAGITGSITLVTPNGSFPLDFGSYDEIDTICSSCSGNVMAQNLRDIINSSEDPLLAGYSAEAAGSTVTIHGAKSGDYYNASSGAISRISNKLGKIYIDGSRWYLPFIDNSLGGSYNDKISFYYGTTGADLSTNTPQIYDAINTPVLANIPSVSNFDNHYDGSNLWISLIKETGSEGEVHKLNTNFTSGSSFQVFAGESLNKIQIAASATYVYVSGTKNVSGNISLGVYNINGNLEAEFDIDDPDYVESESDTIDYFNSSDLSDFKIIPYNSEARIVGISRGTTSSDYKLYLARLREVSSTWTLSCGDCAPISEINKNVSRYVKLGVSSIRNKTTPSTTDNRLSSDGSVIGQGIKDVAFVSFGRITDTNACDPALGVFNVEGESISATTIYDETPDGGLFRPPLIKN